MLGGVCPLTNANQLRYIMQNDVDLVHKIEAVIGKQLDEFECKEKEVLEDITKVSDEFDNTGIILFVFLCI